MSDFVNPPKYQLFLDLDGVLADFNAKMAEILGIPVTQADLDAMSSEEMWKSINAHPSFFYQLDPFAGAVEFVRKLAALKPIILTGVPKLAYPDARAQKAAWCDKWLGSSFQVLSCKSENKIIVASAVAGPGVIPVIVDDWERHQKTWEDGGGTWILHKTFEKSTARITELTGFVPPTGKFPVKGEEVWCPRRGENPLTNQTFPGPDFYGEDNRCSYCGSLHPDVFMERVEKGELCLGATDKDYKVYVYVDSGPLLKQTYRNCPPGARCPGPEVCTHWVTREVSRDKFYFQHLSVNQRIHFTKLYSEKRLKFHADYPFYVLPFFLKSAPKTKS